MMEQSKADKVVSTRIVNGIKEYEEKYLHKNCNEGQFYYNDVQQIARMSANKWDLIKNALYAGYMIGIRKGRRDQKKLQKK